MFYACTLLYCSALFICSSPFTFVQLTFSHFLLQIETTRLQDKKHCVFILSHSLSWTSISFSSFRGHVQFIYCSARCDMMLHTESVILLKKGRPWGKNMNDMLLKMYEKLVWTKCRKRKLLTAVYTSNLHAVTGLN